MADTSSAIVGLECPVLVDSGHWRFGWAPLRSGMESAKNLPPKSLGLWGDGDEIAAISEVERHFGVRLDYADAGKWATAGDVFAALKRELPPERADAADTWPGFQNAIALETGVDPRKIELGTSLLGQGRFSRRLALVVAAVAGLVLALILRV